MSSDAVSRPATAGDEWRATLKAFEGRVEYESLPGADPVNEAMIRHWCVVLGDANPIYTDSDAAALAGHDTVVAPPTMLQVWCMPTQLDHGRPLAAVPWFGGGGLPRTAREELWDHLSSAGFTSVVATQCEQEYVRYLRPGDRLTMASTIESISDEKQTALGRGHFVTLRYDYRDQSGELVGTMLFRMLKFAPERKKSQKPPRPRPAITRDTGFWFDAARQGRLVIQRCTGCGRLRHPPGPTCPACRSLQWDTVDASGRGTVFSYVVAHHPQVPAFDYPLVVAVIELEEGTRLVSNVIDCDPAEVRIGMTVECTMVQFDEELTLPQFRPASEAAPR